MSITYHALLPDEGIQLIAWNGGERFAALFQACWAEIPVEASQRILAYWKSASASGPSIELSTMWQDSKDCFAQVTNRGMVLRFNEHDFRILPTSAARWVIAHELAHVFQKAIGRKPGGEGTRSNEDEANSIAKGWGFDPEEAWMLKTMQTVRGISLEQAVADLQERSSELPASPVK